MDYIQLKGNDVLLQVHVQPGAKKTEWVGPYGDRIKIRLMAPPVDGKANAALCQWLAAQFDYPVREVLIERGETSRQKTVRFVGAAHKFELWGNIIQPECR